MYKKIFFLSILFLTSVVARENPFEPTKTYLEEKARILEIEQDYTAKSRVQSEEEETVTEIVSDENASKETAEVAKVEDENQTLKADAAVKKEEDKKMMEEEVAVKPPQEMPKAQDMSENMAQVKKEDIEKEPKEAMIEKEMVKEETKVIVEIKPELKEPKPAVIFQTVSKGAYDILPFIKMVLEDDKMEIYSKYKVFRKFNIEAENKIVIDYRATKNFYTKRYNLDSDNFKKIIVGNHKVRNYFRIVLSVAELPHEYDVTYSDGNKVTLLKR